MYRARKIHSFLLHFIKQQKIQFLLLFFTSLTWSIGEVFFPYFIKRFIDIVSQQKIQEYQIFSLKAPCIGLIGVWIITLITMRVQSITAIYTFPLLRANIRSKIVDYVRLHSHEYFTNNLMGDIASKINDLPFSVQSILEIILYSFIPCFSAFVISLFLLWMIKPIFCLCILIWFFFHLGINFLLMPKNDELAKAHANAVTILGGRIVDSISNMVTVRLFARDEYEKDHMNYYQKDELNKAKKAAWHTEKARLLQGFLALILIISIIFFLIYGWFHGWVSLGDFSFISMLSFSMITNMWTLSQLMNVYIREKGRVLNSLTLMMSKPEIIDRKNISSLRVFRGEIKFNNVRFSYQGSNSFFNNLTVTIPAKQKVGVVGFSGAGKSTFINLLLRFYDIKDGQILIDNQDISMVTQKSLREQISVIPQDPFLFHRTLIENIRYGKLNASDDEVIQASILAHCHEFIEQLEDKYNTVVGEKGAKLSVGQRQRIAIARAFLKNAPILLLDEATSALDSITEKAIQKSLTHLMQDKTTLVISHRLSTLENMDRILVFSNGKIVEDGSKIDLLKMNKHFAKLWNMQMDGILPDFIPALL